MAMKTSMTAEAVLLADQRAASPGPVIPANTQSPSGTLTDARGRLLRDLRISVTDRCNFRSGAWGLPLSRVIFVIGEWCCRGRRPPDGHKSPAVREAVSRVKTT